MKKTSILLGVILGVASPMAAQPDAPKQETPAKNEAKTPDVAAQLETAKQELAKLRERYRDNYPRVKEQLRKIAELEKQLEAKK